jgi:hypothetical protein
VNRGLLDSVQRQRRSGGSALRIQGMRINAQPALGHDCGYGRLQRLGCDIARPLNQP